MWILTIVPAAGSRGTWRRAVGRVGQSLDERRRFSNLRRARPQPMMALRNYERRHGGNCCGSAAALSSQPPPLRSQLLRPQHEYQSTVVVRPDMPRAYADATCVMIRIEQCRTPDPGQRRHVCELLECRRIGIRVVGSDALTPCRAKDIARSRRRIRLRLRRHAS
jgi:hypothetical protein